MAEKTAHGNTFPELDPEVLLTKLKDRARANGADPVALLESQLGHLKGLSGSVAGALGGDERLQAHLEAQFKLAQFSTEAESYLEAVAWRKALVEILMEIVVAAGEAAIGAVAKGLVGSLNAGME